MIRNRSFTGLNDTLPCLVKDGLMQYALRFRDHVDGVVLDILALEHCRDLTTALRWLGTQSHDLRVELWDQSGLVATRRDLEAMPGDRR